MTTLRDLLKDFIVEVRSEELNEAVVRRYMANHVNPVLTDEAVSTSAEAEEVMDEKVDEFIKILTERIIG